MVGSSLRVALREVGWSLVEGGSSPVTPAWFASGTGVPLSFDITEPNKMAVSETHGVPSKPTMPVHPALRRSVKTRSPLGDDRGTEGSLRRVDRLGSSPPAHCNATHPSAAINANAAYSFGNYLCQNASQRGPPLSKPELPKSQYPATWPYVQPGHFLFSMRLLPRWKSERRPDFNAKVRQCCW